MHRALFGARAPVLVRAFQLMLIKQPLSRPERDGGELYLDVALAPRKFHVADRRFAQVRYRIGAARYQEPVDEHGRRRLGAISFWNKSRKPCVGAEPERSSTVTKAASDLIIGQSVPGCEMPDASGRRIQPFQTVIGSYVKASPTVFSHAPHPVTRKLFGDSVRYDRRAFRPRIVNASKTALNGRDPEPAFTIEEQGLNNSRRNSVGAG